MKQAVILAAGEGQRLRPFTVTKPKVMLPIADKPILQYVVEALAKNGIRQIVIVVGYRREQIFDYMGSGEKFGVNIVYITQEKQLGTANALALVKNSVEDEFLVLHGDNLIEASTIASFTKISPSAILVKKVVNPARYGVVAIENGLVKEIIENPEQTRGNIVNTGIYAFNRDVFDFIGTELHIPDVINRMVLEDKPVNVQETEGTWLDVVYPWDIISLNDAILRRIPAKLGGVIETGASIKGQVSIGNGTTIRSNCYIVGPVIIGENCDIGPNVCIMPATSIGDNVVISPFTEITNSVISDDVNIGSSSLIQDSVIDKGCFIKSHFIASSGQAEVKVDSEHHQVKMGAMLGVNCNVESCVVAQPGSIIGNYSQIQATKLVSGRIPDRSLVI
ncbi:MAG: bifunctional sugar-1-phosphate nucleotidylyltransferase/acetyltransferase [Chloroflexota bacterium]